METLKCYRLREKNVPLIGSREHVTECTRDPGIISLRHKLASKGLKGAWVAHKARKSLT